MNKKLLLINWIALVMGLLPPKVGYCNDKAESENKSGGDNKSRFEEAAIRKNIEVSKAIDKMADAMDIFLAGDRFTDKINETSVIINYIIKKVESEDVVQASDIEARLNLPNTEKHWHLVFDNRDDLEHTRLDQRDLNSNSGNRKFGLGIGYVRKFHEVETKFRPKLKISDPVETAYLLSVERKIEFKSFSLIPYFDFFADSVRGTGQSASFVFEIPMSRKVTLRLNNEEQYLDFQRLFSTAHGPSLSYRHSDRIGFSTSLIAYSNNDQSFHLESYIFSISRLHYMYKNILHYDITPRWHFEKKNDFRAQAEISLGIRLIF